MCPLATHIGAELYVAWKPDIYFNCAYYFTYAPTFGADGKMVESVCANVYVDLKQKEDACVFFFFLKLCLSYGGILFACTVKVFLLYALSCNIMPR